MYGFMTWMVRMVFGEKKWAGCWQAFNNCLRIGFPFSLKRYPRSFNIDIIYRCIEMYD